MKTKSGILGLASLALIGSASAAVTFSTTSAVGLKQSDGTTNIQTSGLVLMIADSTSNGFLASSTNGAVATGGTTALTSLNDVGLRVSDVSTTVGQTFGGDQILGAFSMSGGGSVALALTNVSIVGLENKSFALVYFEKTAAQLALDGFGGAKYGIASGADWTLPASDAGAYTFNATTNTTTSVYWQLASTLTATQVGATGFFTGSGTTAASPVKSAVFTIAAVPEPSAALLGMLGALGLLRRRR